LPIVESKVHFSTRTFVQLGFAAGWEAWLVHFGFAAGCKAWLVHFGFAAGCEAWLRLAVCKEIRVGLRPRCGLCPICWSNRKIRS
jgi:hypothetical protein